MRLYKLAAHGPPALHPFLDADAFISRCGRPVSATTGVDFALISF